MKPAVFISIGVLVVVAAVSVTLAVYQYEQNQRLTAQVQQLTQETNQLRAANAALEQERNRLLAVIGQQQFVAQQSQQQSGPDVPGLLGFLGSLLPILFGF